uniref:START domain-containing protein n=1 Tax=Globisporangium ultimum (strain ATCC 200006 / CBS 805.95 / DAOM BR144) TaxID=431595 RepID=K3WZI8_GLOUD
MEPTDAADLRHFLRDVEDLLADSEALLHSIHTPISEAAAPPSEAVSNGASASRLEHDGDGNALRSDDSNSSVTTSVRTNTHNRKKRSRNSTRDREKEELRFLRRQAAELEQELVAVRNGERHSTTDRFAPAWRRLADRQRQGKYKVEKENKYLKATVAENVSVLKRLWWDAMELSRKNARTVSTRGAMLRCEHERFIEWRDTIVFERLKAQLARDYARTDDVACESGIGRMLNEGMEHSHTRTLGLDDTDTRLGELVDSRLLPFNLHVVSQATWQSMMMVYMHTSLYGVPQSDDAFLCAGYQRKREHDERWIVVKFQQQLHVDGNDVVVHARGLIQRYKEDNRTVYVWHIEYHGDEQSKMSNTDTTDSGWILLQKAPSSCTSSIIGTVIHSKVRVNARELHDDMEQNSVELTKNLISCNEKCIDELSGLVENMLFDAPYAT